MPAAHGVDGKTFGKLVSDLARSGPGAVPIWRQTCCRDCLRPVQAIHCDTVHPGWKLPDRVGDEPPLTTRARQASSIGTIIPPPRI